MSSATEFSPEIRETVMVLATIRAVAAACEPGCRLVGSVRCDDICRAVDELIPLDGEWPGQTRTIPPVNLKLPARWQDGAAPRTVLTGVLDCALGWVPDARLIGPLTAGEVAKVTYHVLTGRDLTEDLKMHAEAEALDA